MVQPFHYGCGRIDFISSHTGVVFFERLKHGPLSLTSQPGLRLYQSILIDLLAFMQISTLRRT